MRLGPLPAIALVLAAAPALAAETYPCAGEYRPLERREGPPDLLKAIFLPLAVIDALTRDHLADKPRKPVPVRVVTADGAPAAEARVGFIHAGEGRFVAEVPASSGSAALPEGRYRVVAALPGKPVRWGVAEVTVGAKTPATVAVRLDRTIPAVAAGAVETAAPAGGTVTVPISGFTEGRLGMVAAGGGKMAAEAELDETGAGSIRVPSKPGTYRLAYMLCAPRLVLAEWTIGVGAADLRIAAPDSVPAGEAFTVSADGRSVQAGDTPDLLDSGAGPDADPVSSGTTEAGAAGPFRYGFRAPVKAGRYEIAFRHPVGDGVLGRRTITVTEKAFSLDLPDEISLAAPFRFADVIPEGAKLEVWALSKDGKPFRLAAEDVGKDVERFPAPAGRYEVRLLPADGGKVLARRGVTVTGRAFASVTGRVRPGGAIEAVLTTKGAFFDKVVLLAPGQGYETFGEYPEADANTETAVTVTAPKKPGKYELVYVLGRPGHDDAVIERVPVEVR
ncbi:carboxypeptidase-like regulatory domain-containing protein [Prosthecomicrobium sp. N25]|uniref:carboxypeptidase-like regulatory domain-containing protein n=1 Tax=Prosthecomicrobium sp. N25 TaxID=3129254 RepID=UPI003077C413